TDNSKSYWLTSGIFTLLKYGSALVFNFGSNVLLYYLLSVKESGVWSLFLIIAVNFIEVSRSGLIQNGLIRYLSITHVDDHPKIITASFTLNLILTAITVTLLGLGGHWLALTLKMPEIEPLFYFYIITTLLLIPFLQFQYIQQANMDFRGVFWGNFVKQGVNFGVIVIAYALHYTPTLLNLVHLQTLTTIAGTFVAWFFVRRFLKFSKVIDWTWVKKLFDYGKYVFTTNLGATIFGSIDSIMLSMLIPAQNGANREAVAFQGVALRITNVVEVPTNAMADILFPQSARRLETQGKEGVKYLYEKAVGVIIALVLPGLILLYLFPRFAILLVTGKDEFLEAVAILQITILYTIFVPFDRQCGTILDSIGKQRLNFLLTAFNAVVNIVSNYTYIKLFNLGLLGASYGTLTTYIISFVLRQMILRRELGVNLANVFVYAFGFYGEMFKIGKNFLQKRVSNG
ncbi:MAG: flippase, partial [Verrucomicrobia bacterium]|nr:flippase [Cytophagales bacterium]